MVTNDLGACEWFVWDLRRSGLIDRGQLDSIVSEFLRRNPRAEAPALAEYLVSQGTLTGFQAERILNGKTQGLVLGPYILLDAIGQGSMGQVYKASSKNDSGFYAVKVLPRRSMWNVRLARRQVRSFASINHGSVVPFVDVGTAGGLHYLVWPLAEGSTLESIVQQNGRLSAAQTALIGVHVAQGLNICHQNSIFHGLIKPSNIMVGNDGQTRILDFGIGSLLVENEGESLVDTMSTANTLTSGLDCASPESIMEPTNRTPAGDQYSLGCVLYYCLTGRVPFPEGSAVEKMMAHQTKEPMAIKEFAPECPDGLAAVVARLMAKNPEERYSGSDEVVEALEPYISELSGSPEPIGVGAASSPPKGRSGHAMTGLGGGGPQGRGMGAGSSFGGSNTPARPMPGLAPSTPPPVGRLHPQQPPAPPSRSAPLPPVRTPSLPSRSSFKLPSGHDHDVPLQAVQGGGLAGLPLQEPTSHHGGHSDPAALRASAGWLNDAAAEADQQQQAAPNDDSEGSSTLGTVGLMAAAAILMVLVFIGAKLLMN